LVLVTWDEKNLFRNTVPAIGGNGTGDDRVG